MTVKFPEKNSVKIENTTEYWSPETKDEQLIGILTDSREGMYGTTYFLNTGDKIIGTPSHKLLQGMMAQVPKNSFVRITYLGIGEAKKGQNAPALYTVEHAPQ